MRTLPTLITACTAAAVVLTATPAAAAPSGDDDSRRPHAVLIGGNLAENAEIIQSIVDLADPDGAGPAKARIAIVTAAARSARTPAQAADPSLNNAAANGLYYSDLFQQFGAETYAVPIDTSVDYEGDRLDRADDPEVVAELADATASAAATRCGTCVRSSTARPPRTRPFVHRHARRGAPRRGRPRRRLRRQRRTDDPAGRRHDHGRRVVGSPARRIHPGVPRRPRRARLRPVRRLRLRGGRPARQSFHHGPPGRAVKLGPRPARPGARRG